MVNTAKKIYCVLCISTGGKIMNVKKLILSLTAGVLAAAVCAGAVPKIIPDTGISVTVSAVSSGKCGKNVTWEIDKSGTVTISGKGKMDDYSYLVSTPFGNSDTNGSIQRSRIKKVVIKSGVTSIGNAVFYGCINIESITIPDSVTSIGQYSFNRCRSLKKLTIPKGVKTIGANAFLECLALTSISLPKSVTSIGEYAFSCCSALSEITIMNLKCNIDDNSGTICNSYSSKGSYKGVICGYDDSTAQAYAKKYGYTFKSMGQDPDNIPLTAVKATGVKGDANGDSKMNVRDAANIAKYASRNKLDLLPKNADFNGDGKVNVRDAAAIAKYMATGKQ